MYQSLKTLFVFGLCLLSIAVNSAAHAEDRQYTIVMVLWRGLTDAERGFMDYLKSEGIKADFIIKDCNKDKSKLPGFIADIRNLQPIAEIVGLDGKH